MFYTVFMKNYQKLSKIILVFTVTEDLLNAASVFLKTAHILPT